MRRVKNIFSEIPEQLPEELVEEIIDGTQFRIERIVSNGHVSPPGFWYDQQSDEWVILLKGAARLRFADCEKPVSLKSGDHMFIPAHGRHRVEWTDPDQQTIWLAVWLGKN
jgi:cupin 2 domain-containing protein